MKKFAAVFLCAVIIMLTFAGCTEYKDCPVEIQGAYITPGIYAYYLDKVMTKPKAYSAKKDDEESIRTAALELCKNHIALASFMESERIVLGNEYKSQVANRTEGLWSLFSDYYQQLGILKSDITKIMTFEESKKQLVQYYYGVGGKKEVSEDSLKQSFVDLYVGFKAFEAPLTKVNSKGETVALSDKEKEKVIEEFREMARKANNGTSIDKIYENYCNKQGLVVTSDLSVSLMKDGDPMYDDDFFKKVSTISHGYTGIIVSEKTVYVVQRCTIATSDEDAFAAYRTEVLEHEKMPAVEKQIASLAESYEPDIREKQAEAIYKAVAALHEQ